jgi:hypothetical protein
MEIGVCIILSGQHKMISIFSARTIFPTVARCTYAFFFEHTLHICRCREQILAVKQRPCHVTAPRVTGTGEDWYFSRMHACRLCQSACEANHFVQQSQLAVRRLSS